MCGYVVIKSDLKTEPATLKKMQKKIEHRGRDDNGTVVIDEFNNFVALNNSSSLQQFNIGFAFQRLSILDLSSNGHQPMVSQDKRFIIVYNGEIYNFLELKEKLISKGHNFVSNTDTEVVLKLFEVYGVKMLDLLNGMFSLVIYDRYEEKFFLARDRLGIKPLYFFKDNNNFFVSSEIKAFTAHPAFQCVFDEDGIDEYMLFRYRSGRKTMFRNVFQCLPGEYIFYQKNKITFKQYWDAKNKKQNKTTTQTQEELEQIFKSSIKYQLISDVEVGSQLSGGIDSSLVTAISSMESDLFKRTFSVIFEDQEISEEKYIDFINNKFSLVNSKRLMQPEDLLNYLEDATWHFDQPLSQPNAIGIYLLAENAKKFLKVLLSGEGSDEIFGGYDRYYPARIFCILSVFAPLVNSLRSESMKRNGDSLQDILICLSSVSKEDDIKQVVPMFDFNKALEERRFIFNQSSDRTVFEKFLTYDQKTYLPELLLRQDKMCMAHGIENRVPFLDHRIVEFSKRISSNLKTPINYFSLSKNSKYNTKKILKNISLKYFDEKFVYRDKLGFNMPINKAINNSKEKDYFISLLDEVDKLNIFNKNIYTLENKDKSSMNVLWSLISLGSWLKVFRN